MPRTRPRTVRPAVGNNTARERLATARYITGRARDRADALHLLAALGLTPEQLRTDLTAVRRQAENTLTHALHTATTTTGGTQ